MVDTNLGKDWARDGEICGGGGPSGDTLQLGAASLYFVSKQNAPLHYYHVPCNWPFASILLTGPLFTSPLVT